MNCSLSDTKTLKKHAYHCQVSIHWKLETVFDPIDPPRNPKETTKQQREAKSYDTMIQISTNYDLEQIERQRTERHIDLNKRILFMHLPRQLPQNERDT